MLKKTPTSWYLILKLNLIYCFCFIIIAPVPIIVSALNDNQSYEENNSEGGHDINLNLINNEVQKYERDLITDDEGETIVL